MALFGRTPRLMAKSRTAAGAGNLKVTVRYWLQHHLECAKKSLQRLLASPLSFIITTLMISIAFTIPAAIYVLFNSVDNLASLWGNDRQITLFLNTETSLAKARNLKTDLLKRTDISDVRVINREDALTEFKQETSLGSIVDNLPDNPIPHLIVVEPAENLSGLTFLQHLQTELENIPAVDHVQFDLIWIQRVQAMLDVAFRVLWVITFLLLSAVGLIIANVIRWEVVSRHDEIEIIRLVGGTDAYVRRPFLYSGFWLGFFGAAIAVIVIILSGWIIGQAVNRLSTLVENGFQLEPLSLEGIVVLLLLGGIFGAGGAWFAVSQRLKSLA